MGDTVAGVVELLKEKKFSQVPVFNDNDLVGVLDETDLMGALAMGQVKMSDPIIHLVKGNIVWMQPTDNLQSLVDHFGRGYVALIKDQKGDLQLVTKIDLLDYLGPHL